MAVWLGGETQARGVVRTMRRDSGDVSTLALFVLVGAVVVWVGGSSIRSVLVGVGIAAVGAIVCVPWELIGLRTGGVSLRRVVAIRLGYTWRRLHGLTKFAPNAQVGVPAGVGSLTTTDETVGGAVIAVTEPSRAADQGRKGRYMVTIVESQGDPAKIRTTGQAWSAWLDYLGGDECLVTHLSSVTSVTDWDPTDHIVHVQEDLARVAEPNRLLVQSYAQVIDEVTARAAHQRTWVALRFPVTRRLEGLGVDDEEADDAAVSGEDAVRQAVAEHTAAAIERAGQLGLVMRPLDARHVAGLCRHLMDPDVSPDDMRGLNSELDRMWEGAFPAWSTSRDRRSLVVDGALGRRWMTAWEIPAWEITPGWLPEDWLYPAVTGLTGGVHRSFTTHVELESPQRARSRAKADVTSDSAALSGQAGQVTDGTADAQATASQIRLADLRPGTSTVGVNWSLTVAFHASSARQRRHVENRVMGALADSNVQMPDRLRSQQDMALGLVLPFTKSRRTPLLERWFA